MRLSLPKSKYLSVLTVFSLGVILSLALFSIVHKFEFRSLYKEISEAALDRSRLFQRELDDNIEILNSLGSLYRTSSNVERIEFREFTKSILSYNPDIIALCWIPYVPGPKRQEFEESVKKDGFPDFYISELGKDGKLIAASTRGEYFPASYVEPFNDNKIIFGFDLASEPLRRQAMEKARDEDAADAIAKITLIRGDQEDSACRIFLPVYKNNLPHNTISERRKNLDGYVSVLFNVGSTLELSLTKLKSKDLDISIYDATEEADSELLYFHSSRLRKNPVKWKDAKTSSHKNLECSMAINVAGRKWLFIAWPSPKFLAAHKLWQSWFILFLGIFFSGVLASYLFDITNRVVKINKLIDERTAELIKANKKLTEEIIERTQREFELKKLNLAVEQSPSVVVITDLNGNIEYVNPKFTQLTGYTLEEAIGKNPRILKSGETSAQVYQQLWETISKGKEWHGEFHNKTKNGKLYWEFASISSVKNTQGFIERYIKVAEDITERKRLEKLKDEFVSNVSHELRTPLSIIKEGVSLIFDRIVGSINQKQESVLGTTKENIDRLSRIINELLDISKIESGKIELKKENINLVVLIREIVFSFEQQLRNANLELKLELPEKEIFIYIDKDKIIQVFVNLISNAIKFTKNGFIEISLFEKEEEIVCAVKDTGIGISDENLPKLFDKFQQFGRTIGAGAKGTGLGLAIVKGIIKLHNGDIWVESKLGEGTKFSFTLPKLK